MPLNEPGWWYRSVGVAPSWQARLLQPLSAIYAWVANRRMLREDGLKVACPVICVGNFTAGGTGKTPLACWIADFLKQHDLQPVFLTRGYGGRQHGPVWLDPHKHTAPDVGDEPFLLARHGAVMIAKDRVEGARKILASDHVCDVIIMDDGLQNPSLQKSLSLGVVDAARGFGNGRVIPSGPLRATLSVQAALVDAVICNLRDLSADELAKPLQDIAAHLDNVGFLGQKFFVNVEATGEIAWLNGVRVSAYAGIANPERFFATLRSLGAELVEQTVFRDHQILSEKEAATLLRTAKEKELTLVTTEKDYVRLVPNGEACKALHAQTRVVPIKVSFSNNNEDKLSHMILQVVKKT